MTAVSLENARFNYRYPVRGRKQVFIYIEINQTQI